MLPPVHEDSRAFEFVKHAQRNELALYGFEQLLPNLWHFLPVAEQGEIVANEAPPGFKRAVMAGNCLLKGWISFQSSLDSRLGSDGRTKGQITWAFGLIQGICRNAELGEIALSSLNFRLGHTADEVSLDILRLGVGRVVNVTADVEVVVVLIHDLCFVDEAAIFWQVALLGKDEINFFNVFRAKLVLVLAFSVLSVGIDKEHLAAQRVRFVLVHYEHACGNAGPVEKAGRQADDGFDHVVVNEDFADQFLFATSE